MSWDTVALGEVCTIVNGGTPKSEVSEYWDGELNWITPKEMGKLNSREIISTERKITEKGIKNSSAKLLPINSVILSSRAPIGHLVINKSLMATNQGCKGLVPSERLHYEYLYYFLSHSKQLLNDMGSGATFKELSSSKLATVEIPLPPLSTQKKIVEKLDAIFAEIDKAKAAAEANAKNAEALFQSYLTQVFKSSEDEWKKDNLTNICKVTTGKWDANHAVENGAYRFYTCASQFLFCDTKRYDGKNIILPGNGANVGELYFYDGAFDAYQRTYVLSEIKIIPEYLFYHLKSNWEETNRFKQYGSATNFLKIGNFKDYIVRYPAMEKQKNIVAKLDAVSTEVKKSAKSYTDKVSELVTLKQSILNQAFSGELVKE